LVQEKANYLREVAYARSDVFDKRRKLIEAWAGSLANKAGTVVKLRSE
jgi:hypothetical protein